MNVPPHAAPRQVPAIVRVLEYLALITVVGVLAYAGWVITSAEPVKGLGVIVLTALGSALGLWASASLLQWVKSLADDVQAIRSANNLADLGRDLKVIADEARGRKRAADEAARQLIEK